MVGAGLGERDPNERAPQGEEQSAKAWRQEQLVENQAALCGWRKHSKRMVGIGPQRWAGGGRMQLLVHGAGLQERGLPSKSFTNGGTHFDPGDFAHTGGRGFASRKGGGAREEARRAPPPAVRNPRARSRRSPRSPAPAPSPTAMAAVLLARACGPARGGECAPAPQALFSPPRADGRPSPPPATRAAFAPVRPLLAPARPLLLL